MSRLLLLRATVMMILSYQRIATSLLHESLDRRYIERFHARRYEDRGHLRYDGIPVGAQLAHTGGYPCSQRVKSGLSAPGFAISAGEEGVVVPGASTAC